MSAIHFRHLMIFVAAGLAAALLPAAEDAGYVGEVNAARVKREQRLTAPDGWLTLIGLHFLAAGENSVGSAKNNAVVLAAGPAYLGVVRLADDGNVKLLVNPGVEVSVNGQPVLAAELGDGRQEHTVTAVAGTISFYIIDRGGRKALRVKDSEAERRTHFLGIDYFPIDPAWRIEAEWVPFDRPREVPIRNIIGQVSPALVLGKAVFTRDGHTMELLPIQENPDDELFFVISDLTSGDQTYAAARFLYADPPRDGKVVLDFNRAVNPPCAFTPFATCPLPPTENQLPIAVTAGEQDYRGGHE
ncbi:MAG: DUF1684 domain-containing protein [Opitutaceae bacterium]|nr:DUF1684 domain-containing protein [Opitutaceae bacterium]